MMKIDGTVTRVGKFWAVDLPLLEGNTQGLSRKDALLMAADWVESILEPQRGAKATARYTGDNSIEVTCDDDGAMMALILRRQRAVRGLTLADVAARLGQRSANAYARYEKGINTPSLQKFQRLMAAVGEPGCFVWRRGA